MKYGYLMHTNLSIARVSVDNIVIISVDPLMFSAEIFFFRINCIVIVITNVTPTTKCDNNKFSKHLLFLLILLLELIIHNGIAFTVTIVTDIHNINIKV